MVRFMYFNCILISLLLINFSSAHLMAANGLTFFKVAVEEGEGAALTGTGVGDDRLPGDGKGAGKGSYLVEDIKDEQGNESKVASAKINLKRTF